MRVEQRELIFEHQRVSKMTRRDLEDQYINLCDEHYALKREHRCNQEKIKRLLTKILRLSSLSLSDVRAGLNTNLINRPPRDVLSFEEKLQICIFDLEIQNSQVHDRLQNLCKRHGITAPPTPPPPRPYSEMYSNCPQGEHNSSNLIRNRARSCHQINGGAATKSHGENAPDPEIVSNHQHFPEEVPVKLVEEDKTAEKVRELEEKNERLARILNDFNEQLEQERNHSKELSFKVKEMSIRKHISENIEVINLKERLEQSKGEFKKRLEHLDGVKERNEKVLIEERIKLGKWLKK